jgi:mannitol/fructose-specific phosphotransferase system IIA component (Ntr-type)
MKLQSLIDPELALLLDDVSDRDALLGRLAEHIADHLADIDAGRLHRALIEREQKGPTSTPEGVAFPHAMYEGAGENLVAVARVPGGVDFGHADHPSSDLIFALVGPTDAAWQHVSILARLARICHSPGALDALRQATDAKTLYEILESEDARHG